MSRPEVCGKCQGTGWLLEDAGGSQVAKRCACFGDRIKQALVDQSNIPRRYLGCSLDNFEVHNDSHRDALKISRQFVKNYPAQDVGLVFIGPCGVGKTHLAVAIIQELIRTKDASCIFYDFRDLIREIQSTFTPESILSRVRRPGPRLLVRCPRPRRARGQTDDGLGRGDGLLYHQPPLQPQEDDPLHDELPRHGRGAEDKRDSFYKKGDESLIDRIGVRLRSRIYEMCKVVEMWGDDYRKMAKQASYRF